MSQCISAPLRVNHICADSDKTSLSFQHSQASSKALILWPKERSVVWNLHVFMGNLNKRTSQSIGRNSE